MKKIINTIIIFCFLAISCQKLDEVPYSFLSSENLYQNELDVDKAIFGIYNAMQLPFVDFDLMLLTIAPSEHTVVRLKNSYQGKYSSLTSDSNDPSINNIWTQFYLGINRANAVMNNIDKAELEAAKEKEKIAECRFMRAFYYFHLVRLFGDIPLHLQETSDFSDNALKKPRSPIIDVYDVIIEDLVYAEDNLPNNQNALNLGRATKGAAKSLLGKAFLTMAGEPLKQTDKYQLAAQKLKQVVDDKSAFGYELMVNYEEIFSNENEFNSEIIFAIPCIRQFLAGNLLTFFGGAPNCQWAFGGGQYQFGFTLDFYNSYSENDKRKNSALVFEYIDRAGNEIIYNDINNIVDISFGGYKDPNGIATGKHKDFGNNLNPFTHNNDLIYLRYADVLLMLSEAYNEIGESENARLYLNLIRERAGIENITNTDQQILRAAIRNERNWELVGEFTEFYDLQRWGIIQDILSISPDAQYYGAVYNPKMELYPIPQLQRDANLNLVQNPGY